MFEHLRIYSWGWGCEGVWGWGWVSNVQTSEKRNFWNFGDIVSEITSTFQISEISKRLKFLAMNGSVLGAFMEITVISVIFFFGNLTMPQTFMNKRKVFWFYLINILNDFTDNENCGVEKIDNTNSNRMVVWLGAAKNSLIWLLIF